MSISNLLTSGAQAGADLSITCHNVICDAESVFEAGLQTDTITEYTAGAGVSIDGVLLKDGHVAGSLPWLRALKASASLVSGGGGFATFGTFDSVSGSMAGEFSLAGGFTPTVSGIYHVCGRYLFNAGGPSAGNLIFQIGQSGLDQVELTESGYVGGVNTPTISGLIHLTAGVPVYMAGYQTLASPLNASSISFTAILLARV